MATSFVGPMDQRWAFATSESHRLSNRDLLLAGFTHSPWFKTAGFECGPAHPDALLDLEGVAHDCSATRLGDTQLMRMRALVGPSGTFLQLVTWTSGSTAEQAANEFWNSVQLNPTATQTPSREPMAVQPAIFDTAIRKTLGFP